MILQRVVSSLEMTSTEQLIPARSDHMTLNSWEGTPEQLAALHDEIALPHRWPSLAWTVEEWRRRLAAETQRWQTFTVGKDVVGLLGLEAQADAQVEITIFGLRPAWQDQGLGSAALTLAVQSAWSGLGDPPCTVRRIWLHTSTRDGPRALTNYLRRGFTIFSQETRSERLPHSK